VNAPFLILKRFDIEKQDHRVADAEKKAVGLLTLKNEIVGLLRSEIKAPGG
jgi:hypothetical protein